MSAALLVPVRFGGLGRRLRSLARVRAGAGLRTLPALAALAALANGATAWAAQAEAAPARPGPSATIASAAHADDAYWHHRLERGDTLIGLRDRLMRPGSDWRVVQRLNRVANPRRLIPGRSLRIPMALMRLEAEPVEVLHRHGEVQVQRGEAAPQPLGSQAVLAGGDWIVTGPQSSIALRFADDTRILIGPDSRLRIERHARLGAADTLDTRLQLQTGDAEVQVQVPVATPTPRFELRTPVINLGVRGTEFRSRVAGERALAEVERGRIAVGARTLEAGFGLAADAAGVGPARPLLPAPDLAAVPARAERLPLELGFAPLAGAERYRARVFAGDTPEALLLDGLFDQARAGWATDLPDGRYTLRVRAVDAHGIEGREAGVAFELKARPEPPLLLQPLADAVLTEASVNFDWSRSTAAARYRLQVAADAAFTQPVFDRDDLTVTQTRVTLPPGDWFWRLASIRGGVGNGDTGPWSDPRALRRVDPPPAPPAEPPRRSDAGVVFAWSRSALPGVRYQVQVARDAGFDDIVLDQTLEQTETLLDKPAAGTYHVRIRAIDAEGRAGAFGATQLVEVPRSTGWAWLLPLLLLLLL